MSDDGMAIKQNKAKIGVTVSPYLKKRVEEYADTEEFSSVSDFVGVAIAKLLGELDYIKDTEQKTKSEELKIKQTEQNNLVSSLLKTAATNPEFLKLLNNHPELLSELSGKQTRKNQNNNDDDDYETEEILE